MTAVPGLTPPTPSDAESDQKRNANAQDAAGPKGPKKRPEAVQLMIWVWLVAAGGELVHQVLQVILSLLNRDVFVASLRATLKERDEAGNYPDAVLHLAANLYIVGTAVLFIVIIGGLVFMLLRLARQEKSAGMARRLWFAFSLYFVFRILLVFMSAPAGTDVPEWLFVVDGIVQIIVGSAGAMGIAFAVKEETLDYTGELAQVRELEKELRQRELEQHKKAQDADHDDKKDAKK